MTSPVHFTATTFIVYGDKLLLHKHRKLDEWLPMGGHIDPGEIPEEAALREIKEECGLDVDFYKPDPTIDMVDAKQLLRPIHLIFEDIDEEHKHIDFIYYAKAKSNEAFSLDGESDDLKWFNLDELNDLETYDNVKILGKEALDLLSN